MDMSILQIVINITKKSTDDGNYDYAYDELYRFRTYALTNEFFYFFLGVQTKLATLTSFGLQVSYNF